MKYVQVLSLIAAGLLAACTGSRDKPDAYGTFESVEVTVSSQGNGKIMMLNVEEGQELDSGRVVGYVDTTDLHLKKIQAMNQRNATSLRRDDLNAQIAVQEQNQENLMIDKKRLDNLFKDGAATQKQIDDVNGGLNLTGRQIAAIRSQFSGLDQQVASIDQQIAQLQEAIRNSAITNPVRGTVLAKYSENGEIASFGKPIYKIADLREMILRVYVGGTQLPHIRIGQTVEVRFDKDEKTNTKTEGIVSWISPTAEFTPKTIQTKEERVNLVYAVKVRVKNDGSLKIGMPGEIRLSEEQK